MSEQGRPCDSRGTTIKSDCGMWPVEVAATIPAAVVASVRNE